MNIQQPQPRAIGATHMQNLLICSYFGQIYVKYGYIARIQYILRKKEAFCTLDYYYSLLETIAAGIDSSLILFFIILAALVLPLYGLLLRERRFSRQHDNRHPKTKYSA